MHIHSDIQQAIKRSNLVFFVGSGFSRPLGLPNWTELIREVTEVLKQDYCEDELLLNLATKVANEEYGEIEALDLLKEKGYEAKIFQVLEKKFDVDFSKCNLSRHEKLWQITDQVVTTNYDLALELNKPEQIKKVVYNDDFHVARLSEMEHFLFKIHGCIARPADCVLFSSQYKKLYSGKTSVALELFQIFSSKTIIFLGFSLNDPFVKELLKLRQKAYRGLKHKNFIITTEEKDFSNLGVERITGVTNYAEDLDEFLNELYLIRQQYPYGFGMLLRGFEKERKEFDEEKVRKIYDSASLETKDPEIAAKIQMGEFQFAEEKLKSAIDRELASINERKDKAAEMSFELARLKHLQLKYEEALKYYQRAAELNPESHIYKNELGSMYANLGDYDNALQYYFEAVKAATTTLGENDPFFIGCQSNIGVAFMQKGEYLRAFEQLKVAASLSEKSKVDHSTSASIYNNIGNALMHLGYYKASIKTFEVAFTEELKNIGSITYKKIPIYLHSMGCAWFYLGNLDHATKYFESALSYFKDSNDTGQPELGQIYNSIGMVKLQQDNIGEAMAYFKKSLAIFNQVYNDNHPRVIMGMNSIGETMSREGRYKQAIKYLMKVLDLALDTFGEDHLETVHVYNNIGAAYIPLKDFEKALKYFQKSLDILRKAYAEHPDIAGSQMHVGITYMYLRKFDQALEYLQQALPVNIKYLGEDHPTTQTCREKIKICQDMLDRDNEA